MRVKSLLVDEGSIMQRLLTDSAKAPTSFALGIYLSIAKTTALWLIRIMFRIPEKRRFYINLASKPSIPAFGGALCSLQLPALTHAPNLIPNSR